MADTEITDLLLEHEDASSVVGMAMAIEGCLPHILTAIGQLMVDSEDSAAANLRDHAQMLPDAANLLRRLHSALEE